MNIYEIKHGAYSAKINLSRGANCISLRNSQYNANILREPDYSKPLDNPYLYGMPILFPVNRISGGKFEFEGREYVFPVNEPNTGCHIHGIVHEQEFQIVSGGEDYVVCSYRPNSKEQYFGGQHDFEIVIGYRLTEQGLEQKTEIKNLSSENMPIMVGFHTTFRLPFMDNQSTDDLRICTEVTDLIERNMDTCLPTGKIPKQDEITQQFQQGTFSPFSQSISRHYKSGANGMMYIRDTKRGISVQYENSANMGFRLLYNGNADEFICMEPQNCVVNCMNENFDAEYAGFQYIRPSETEIFLSKITILSCN